MCACTPASRFLHVQLFNPMDCSLAGSSAHGESSGKNPGVGCHVPVQGIFPTQGLNLPLLQLLQCRLILYL